MTLNCITVDDEPIALSLISSYVAQTPFLKLIGSCTSAMAALKVLHENPEIQLVFLDIRMVELSGLELARIIDQSSNRKNLRIIFTTAYDQYALEGYKVAALDYLLKPFNLVDFTRSAVKALEYFSAINIPANLAAGPAIQAPAEKEYLYLKVEYQLVKVDIQDILYIEGLKDYVKLYLQHEEKPVLTIATLKSMEEKLSGHQFIRLHRSFIVALNKIRSVTKTSVQIGQTTIQVTDQYRDVFAEFLSRWV